MRKWRDPLGGVSSGRIRLARRVRSLGSKRLDIGVLSKNEGAARLDRDFGFEDFRIQMTKRLA